MGIWKDPKRQDWRYAFEYHKHPYAGGGFSSRNAAVVAAREERRKEVMRGLQEIRRHPANGCGKPVSRFRKAQVRG